MNTSAELQSIEARLKALDIEKDQLLTRKNILLTQTKNTSTVKTPATDITAAEKVFIFQNLFIGRQDIFATRWENASGVDAGSPLSITLTGGWCGFPRVWPNHPGLQRGLEKHAPGSVWRRARPDQTGDRRAGFCRFQAGRGGHGPVGQIPQNGAHHQRRRPAALCVAAGY